MPLPNSLETSRKSLKQHYICSKHFVLERHAEGLFTAYLNSNRRQEGEG